MTGFQAIYFDAGLKGPGAKIGCLKVKTNKTCSVPLKMVLTRGAGQSRAGGGGGGQHLEKGHLILLRQTSRKA